MDTATKGVPGPLYTLALNLGQTLDVEAEAAVFMTWLQETLFHPLAGALLLADEEKGVYRLVQAHALPADDAPPFPDPQGFLTWFRAHIPGHLPDPLIVHFPVRRDDRVLAHLVLAFTDADRDAVQKNRDLLQQALALLAPVLHHARRFQCMQEELARASTSHNRIETLYQALVEQALVGVYLFQDGIFVYVNQALADMFGYTREELIGKRGPRDLTHPDDYPLVVEKIRQRLQGDVPVAHYRFRGLRKDGSVLRLEAYGQRIHYQGQSAIWGMLIDVTELAALEEAYRALVTHSLQGLVILQDDRLVFVNLAFARFVGYDQDELLNSSFEELVSLIHPDDRPRVVELKRKSMAGDPQEFYTRFRYVSRDGAVHWAEARGSRITYQGRPALQVAYMDISDRVEMEQHLQRQLAYLQVLGRILKEIGRVQDVHVALEHTIDAMLDVLDLRMGAIWYRGAGKTSLATVVRGMPEPDGVAMLRHMGDMLPEDIWERQEIWLVEDWSHPPEVLAPVADIMTRLGVCSSVAVPIRTEEDSVGGLVVACDVQRVWREEDVQFVLLVGREIGVALERLHLVKQLRATNEVLREALQAKDEMIQNVSHELRTPLTIVKGYLELLQEKALGPLTSQQESAVLSMLESAERLRFMIDRLILLRILDSYKITRMPLDMSSWLQNTLVGWQQRTQKSGIVLVLDVEPALPPLHTDPLLLEEVLKNLLDNAIKFSPNGGEVRIRVRHEGTHVHLSVSDQGIGVPPDQLERIFEHFYQVDRGTTRHFEGLGIGLALCRHIVDRLGGRIWAESAGRDQGTTFHVLLPVVGGRVDAPEAAS